jgi:hypothetical protein
MNPRQLPSSDEIEQFCERLRIWRESLAPREGALCDSMIAAAFGQTSADWVESRESDDLNSTTTDTEHLLADCWQVGLGYWLATPWGMTHTRQDR